jgi:hypothetical protein
MILKSLYKSVSSIPNILLYTRQTNVLPDCDHTQLLRVIVQAVAITAEHYKFCWLLSITERCSKDTYSTHCVCECQR